MAQTRAGRAKARAWRAGGTRKRVVALCPFFSNAPETGADRKAFGVLQSSLDKRLIPAGKISDGSTIALECIAKEAGDKTGFLDLGRLGLSELPHELFQLKHLRRLNLGWRYFDVAGQSSVKFSQAIEE
ncbi:MAG: hypothetical protein L0Y60_17760, partial [Beijerinckiaceae bacterium]|nr:hypothetical protein [Beijerinckiaceae bacterium]